MILMVGIEREREREREREMYLIVLRSVSEHVEIALKLLLSCSNLSAGTFQSSVGSTSCSECLAGSFCATEGLSQVTAACQPGTYSSALASICTSCSQGAHTFQGFSLSRIGIRVFIDEIECSIKKIVLQLE